MNNPHNPVAANTLFHFTSSIDNLKNILTNEFLPNYCIEDWGGLSEKNSEHSIPWFIWSMVCFCDIPLSQIRNHISKYGGYGIGLTKKWGVQHKITPVLYIHEQSPTIEYFTAVENALEHIWFGDNTSKITTGNDKEIALLPGYFKPYKGRMWDKTNNKFFNDLKDFYEEREWRYIPPEEDGYAPMIDKVLFYEKNFRKEQEQKAKSKKLSFNPNDIKYIIVNSEAEISEMISKIKDIKSPKYENKDIELLITRIISMEHILADF